LPRLLIFAIVLIIGGLNAAVARAQSDTYKVHPLEGPPVAGKLGDITHDKVSLQTSSGTKEFAVNEIKFVQLPSEPRDLLEARIAALDGNDPRVLELVDKIPPPQLASEAIRQEVDYYRAMANAHLALDGQGDPAAAGKTLLTWLRANANSYHYYDANQTTGDLLMSLGRNDQATPYYNEVASAPWPEFKQRAAVALGKALQADGKHLDAIKQFDAAIAADTKAKSAEAQVAVAKIWKAKSLIELGDVKTGLQLVTEAIDKAPPDDLRLQADAYLIQGAAYTKLKQPKQAIYAYLHVDDVYNQVPAQHAEALAHLKDLWAQIDKPQTDRAQAAAETLKAKYPTSPWNK
jgi:tetratricopeptide (TPR) repeat protein